MNVRKIEKEDMNYINSWWVSHNWQPVHPYMLSPDGYIVTSGEKRFVAGWYGTTNSKTAIMEWIVKNPRCTREEVDESLSLLCEAIEQRAKSDNYKAIATIIEHKNLKKFLSNRSFTEGDKKMDTYLKIL
jgi:hypothetical protein